MSAGQEAEAEGILRTFLGLTPGLPGAASSPALPLGVSVQEASPARVTQLGTGCIN